MALGPAHPTVAEILTNLATMLRATNREMEATQIELRASAIRAIRR